LQAILHPSDEAATKIIFLVLRQVVQERKIPPRGWAEAKTQFAIMFGDRFVRT
jgi:putative transposase